MTVAEAKEIVKREYPRSVCCFNNFWADYEVFQSRMGVESIGDGPTKGAAWKAAAEAILAQKGK